MSFKIGYVDSWLNRLRDKVYEQFKGLPNIDAIVQALAFQAQELEESGQALLLLLSIDDCTGAQLRMLGVRVGQPYAGEDDETFRLYLRARIAANRSDGNTEALYAVFRAMLGAAIVQSLVQSPIKSFQLTISDPPLTEAQGLVALDFLHDAKEAADRGLLAWQGFVDAEMFYTSLACYHTGGSGIGDANMDVDDASEFPPSGTLIIDEGTPSEETIDFDYRSDVSIHFTGGALASAHDAGAVVALVGSPGKGFPLATFVNVASAPLDSAFDVVDSAGFATHDVIIVDEGLANEETFTVSGVIAGAISVTPAIANVHATGAAIVLVGSGGSLASIAQA